MIKLVENNREAKLVLEHLSVDAAPLIASKMFTEGFGVNRDFLQFYAAFDDSGNLCAAFVRCNDRVFCLIEALYNKDEILWFLKGFQDYKIFISSHFAYIIPRTDFNRHLLMKKQAVSFGNNDVSTQGLESKPFTEIIMKGKGKEASERFFLNNSHLVRHGYLKNYCLVKKEQVCSVASVYDEQKISYLCNVFTPEDFRHRGYASRLVNKITGTGREYHLICGEEVSPLYIKCGFRPYSGWIEFLY